MGRRELGGAAAVLATAVVFGGCGGGSGGDGSAAAAVVGEAPTGGTPLDQQLRAALAQRGIRPVTTVAAESTALVELGRALFFDKLLSGNRNVSCATCHHPTAATGDALPLSLGEGASGTAAARTLSDAGQVIARNAPPLFHVAAADVDVMFWDGRVRRDPDTGALTTPVTELNGVTPPRPDLAGPLTTALAAQAMFPVTSREEMRGQPGENELADAPDEVTVWALLMARLVGTNDGTTGGIEGYRQLFRAAYPDVVTYDALTFGHAARAIAAFEQAEYALFDTPLDRYLAGDDAALSEQAKRGGLVFTGPGRCARCHDGPLLSDQRFHAIAAPQLGPGAGGEPDDRGRALITGDGRDDHRFRTPPLRQVEATGPWTHAGAFTTLDGVLRHYGDPGQSLLGYDATQLPPAFQGLVDADPTRNQARIAAVDGVIGTGIRLGPGQVADLGAFLRSLTDARALGDLGAPATVPSGLPVAD